VNDDEGRNKANALRWTIVRPEMAGNPSSPDSPTRQSGPNGEKASQASHESVPSQEDLERWEASFFTAVATEPEDMSVPF
jgi:hypothetical protein